MKSWQAQYKKKPAILPRIADSPLFYMQSYIVSSYVNTWSKIAQGILCELELVIRSQFYFVARWYPFGALTQRTATRTQSLSAPAVNRFFYLKLQLSSLVIYTLVEQSNTPE